MHRAGDARIIGPDEHLGEELDVPVLLSFLRVLLGQRHEVVLDIGVVLARGDHAVTLDDPAFLVELIAVFACL